MARYDLEQWVKECAELTQPDSIHWCDGSDEEYRTLIDGMVKDGTLIEMNQKTHPGCYYHRSNPNDVARTEHLTFICSQNKEDVGPNNNWMLPDEAKEKGRAILKGSMRGRKMYVIPYLMGPIGSPYARAGVQVTDSPYVTVNMRIMTRIGTPALEHIRKTGSFVPGLHGLADVNPERRLILHFPEEELIWSIGTGYGGNALLGKKCFALRIGSAIAKKEGWMAEHMLIIGLEDPKGKVHYMAAAFPSASGKTNLAMMVSSLKDQGWKIWTVGDDIAWMNIDKEGQLRAINPEAGFFGVAPGTSVNTNPMAMETIKRNTIYTNVALTKDLQPWWEGIETPPSEGMLDWRGNVWDGKEKAAHPNSRFTAPASQCPMISPEWESPEGVPISAIIFGSRRSSVVPLVMQSYDWDHGVFVGATMGAETTAAQTGAVGVVRRDPMAMLPFCGYNMADYFGHWFEMGKRIKKKPLIFRVNWFRKSADGKFLWPGYGDNIRVLKWILERVQGAENVQDSPIGYIPKTDALDLSGMNMPKETLEEIFRYDKAGWENGLKEIEKFLSTFGDRMPREMWNQYESFKARVQKS